MFERLPEIIVLCVVGLLVFGPKRVIEMGGALGKAWREFRESTKDLSWSALLAGDEQPNTQHYSSVTEPAAPPAAAIIPPQPVEAATSDGAHGAASTSNVVEGSIEPQPQHEGEGAASRP